MTIFFPPEQLPGGAVPGSVRQGGRAAAHHPPLHAVPGGGRLPRRQGGCRYQGHDPRAAGHPFYGRLGSSGAVTYVMLYSRLIISNKNSMILCSRLETS